MDQKQAKTMSAAMVAVLVVVFAAGWAGHYLIDRARKDLDTEPYTSEMLRVKVALDTIHRLVRESVPLENVDDRVVRAVAPATPEPEPGAVKPAAPPPRPALKMTGVIRTRSAALAVINGEVVGRGDRVGGYTVLAVRGNSATLKDRDGKIKILNTQ